MIHKLIPIFLIVLTTSCSNKEEVTGKTSKGDLKSPCVSAENGPCSKRFNPNIVFKGESIS